MSFSIRKDITYDDINTENINVENNGVFGGDITIDGGNIASTAAAFNLLRFDTMEGVDAGPATITLGDAAAVVTIPGTLDATLNSVTGSVHAPSVEFLGAATDLPDTGTKLVKNTYYESSFTNTEKFLLPTVADSVVGDWIKYRNLAATSNLDKITIGSAANDDFVINSRLTGFSIVAAGTIKITTDVSEADDNSIIFEGQTDGSGGAGSEVLFVFNGTAWVASGFSLAQGNGTGTTVGDSNGIRFAETA